MTSPTWPRFWDNSDPEIVDAMAELDRLHAVQMTDVQLGNVVRLFTNSISKGNANWAKACRSELDRRLIGE